jgi:hypothetical protein
VSDIIRPVDGPVTRHTFVIDAKLRMEPFGDDSQIPRALAFVAEINEATRSAQLIGVTGNRSWSAPLRRLRPVSLLPEIVTGADGAAVLGTLRTFRLDPEAFGLGDVARRYFADVARGGTQ